MATMHKPKEKRYNYLYVNEIADGVTCFLFAIGLSLAVFFFICLFVQKISESFFYHFLIFFSCLPVIYLYYFLFKKYRKFWKNYRNGRWGEKFLKGKLSFLSNDFHVFPDIFMGEKKSNIDFVVVGPTGVFIIETKECYSLRHDDFEKNRKRVAGQARFLRKNILESLSDDAMFFVDPILVISNMRGKKKEYGRTMVLSREEIVNHIENNQKKFSPRLISKIIKLLDNHMNNF